MDTVSVQGMEISPFDPRFHNGLVYGRGACDTKAGLAAMMHAMAAIHLANEIPACNVWLAAVVDEEYSFRGVLKLCETLRADAAIIAEPTDLRIAVASKGVLRWRIIARGRAAHSSKCDLGVNAIYHMAQVIRSIEAEHMRLGEIVHPLLGPASCNVGKISGGVQVNFVPAECTIEIDRRLLPGEDVDQVMRGFQTLIDDLKQSIPEMDVVMESPMLVDSAWTVDQQTAVVSTAREVSRFLAMESDPVGVPFGARVS